MPFGEESHLGLIDAIPAYTIVQDFDPGSGSFYQGSPGLVWGNFAPIHERISKRSHPEDAVGGGRLILSGSSESLPRYRVLLVGVSRPVTPAEEGIEHDVG